MQSTKLLCTDAKEWTNLAVVLKLPVHASLGESLSDSAAHDKTRCYGDSPSDTKRVLLLLLLQV